MRKPGGSTRKKSTPGIKVLVLLLFIGGIALALKPSINWIKGHLLHMEVATRQDSLREQNRRNWCADVLESDSISQSDYNYCEDLWKD
jgi:hypothetical protein